MTRPPAIKPDDTASPVPRIIADIQHSREDAREALSSIKAAVSPLRLGSATRATASVLKSAVGVVARHPWMTVGVAAAVLFGVHATSRTRGTRQGRR